MTFGLRPGRGRNEGGLSRTDNFRPGSGRGICGVRSDRNRSVEPFRRLRIVCVRCREIRGEAGDVPAVPCIGLSEELPTSFAGRGEGTGPTRRRMVSLAGARFRNDFGLTYELNCEPEKYILNMEDIESIDSSALGMLLLLRNHAGGDEADIRIVNASPDIVKLMHTCKFDSLFNIIQ